MEWKSLPYAGADKLYEISDTGLIRKVKNKKIINNVKGKNYYYANIILVDDTSVKIKIYRMVAKAFVHNSDPLNNTYVFHVNFNRYDDNKKNLSWVCPTDTSYINKVTFMTKMPIIQKKKRKMINKYPNIVQASNNTKIHNRIILDACFGLNNSIAGDFEWNFDTNKNDVIHVDLSDYKQIVDFPNYVINCEGKVYNLITNRFVKYSKGAAKKCLYVCLANGKKKLSAPVHRLVASYFLPKNDDKDNCVKQLDHDKTNVHVDNLEWKFMTGFSHIDDHHLKPYYEHQ